MPADLSHEKRALRAELRERRRIMPSTEREAAATALTENLERLATELRIRSVAGYLSRQDEPNIRPFVHWAHDRGIRVLLPVSRVDGLLDWAPYDGGEEELDPFGMPAPTSDLLSPMAISEVDLILVPAACVDATGMRMGWGRGYFDKTLGSMEKRPPVYAVLFESELVDEVPSEVHDQRVDGVVRPSGILTF
jgi:5-formyltetrahydrofolate cyclo-ligase